MLVRAPPGPGRPLLPISLELSEHLTRVQLFRLPDLFSQPLQLGKLFEQIRRKLLK